MRSLPRALALVLLAPFVVLAGSVAPAHADPKPGIADPWPRCGTAPDDDGQYCIISITKNGVPVPPVDYGTPGVYDNPYVDLIGPGDVRFGLTQTTVSAVDPPVDSGSVAPGDTYVYRINAGSIDPVEMYGTVRDTDMSFGGNATTGHTITLTFKPAPVAWMFEPGGPAICSYDGGCGGETWVADYHYDGFVTGYVTDDATSGLGASEIADRLGYIQSYNAQDAYPFYDIDTNTLEIRMANAHFKTPSEVAVGFYDTFLPNAYLVNDLSVPDPASLSATSLSVVRAGSTDPVTYTLTHEPGGIRIHISGITFSRARYKIHPKPTAPGVPRWGSVHRLSHHAVRVAFRRPLANGGKPITSYDARCRRGTGAWHAASGASSPLVVRNVPRRPVTCQVRAVNRIGHGRWSHPRGQS
jgi:hypothetical protein